ncbi:MAG: hypothetical protein U1G07_00540 [Verrucomicrobiota bacterium]
MIQNKEQKQDLMELTRELHRVREASLAASRRDDFRTVARLTAEAARLNRLIVSAEGTHIPSLQHLSDRLFTSEPVSPFAEARSLVRPELAAA